MLCCCWRPLPTVIAAWRMRSIPTPRRLTLHTCFAVIVYRVSCLCAALSTVWWAVRLSISPGVPCRRICAKDKQPAHVCWPACLPVTVPCSSAVGGLDVKRKKNSWCIRLRMSCTAPHAAGRTPVGVPVGYVNAKRLSPPRRRPLIFVVAGCTTRLCCCVA